MTVEVNSGPRWTDQTNHIASMKQKLAAMLKDDEFFAALDCWPIMSESKTAENQTVWVLKVVVCSLRDELIEWAERR
jgi:hypothetical protein